MRYDVILKKELCEALDMKHFLLLLLAALAIFYSSGSVASALNPSDRRLYTWIAFHGLYYSPTFLVGYALSLLAFKNWNRLVLRAFIAFLIGLISWGIVYAIDLKYKVIPDVKTYEDERKDRIEALQKKAE